MSMSIVNKTKKSQFMILVNYEPEKIYINDSYNPSVSNKDAKGNLTSGPFCAFPSMSTRSTTSKQAIGQSYAVL